MDVVLAELSISSLDDLRKLLDDWGLDEYYGYNEIAVFRNNKPTTWERIIPKLKKAGFREDADKFEKRLNNIEENIEKNHQNLVGIEEKLELIYDETRKKSIRDHSITELLELEKGLETELGEIIRSVVLENVRLKMDLAEERYEKNRKPDEIQFDQLVTSYRNIQKYLEDEGRILDLEIRKAKILEFDKKINDSENTKKAIHKFTELQEKIDNLMEYKDWGTALDILKTSKNLCTHHGWEEYKGSIEKNIVECRRRINVRKKLMREPDETLTLGTHKLEEKKHQEASLPLVVIPGTNVKVRKLEYNVLVALREIIGEDIPEVDKIEMQRFGFTAEKNHIIGLGLFQKGLRSFPDKITNLKSLKILRLDSNILTSISTSISSLKSLKKLYLNSNEMSSLPDIIGNLKSLEVLNLEYNKLSSLPQSIDSLKSLKTLDLGSNDLSSLPNTIGNLNSLETLNLYNNRLSSLPETIGNLKSLKELWLGANNLSILPETIGNLKFLKKLWLGENNLSSLPRSIARLKSLKWLNIENNAFPQIMVQDTQSALRTLKKNGCTIRK